MGESERLPTATCAVCGLVFAVTRPRVYCTEKCRRRGRPVAERLALEPHRSIIAYIRVSTRQQGHDGLGMEAQRDAVEVYAASRGLPIVAIYAEVETGRKADLRNRPQLGAALAHSRRLRALLVIARIDRLSRNVFVTAQLLESGVDFVACDNPHANRMTVQILAVMAEHESRMISTRTRAANATARARGVDFSRPENVVSKRCQQLGTEAANRAAVERTAVVYRDLIPIVAGLRAQGLSLARTADALNALGHCNQRGGYWTRGTIYTLLRREGMSLEPPAAWVGKSSRRSGQAARTAERYAPLLQEVHDRRARGETLRSIAIDLRARGVSTFRGYPFTTATLMNLLQRHRPYRL